MYTKNALPVEIAQYKNIYLFIWISISGFKSQPNSSFLGYLLARYYCCSYGNKYSFYLPSTPVYVVETQPTKAHNYRVIQLKARKIL